jgi:two-component system, sensor histidine kinase
MRKTYSLRAYLLGTLLLAAVVPIALLSFFHARTYESKERQETGMRLQEAADAIGENLLLRISLALHGLETEAQDIAAAQPQNRLDRPQIEESLARFRKIYNEFVTVILIDDQGRVVAQHMDVPLSNVPPYGRSVADRDYFQQPMATGQPFVSNMFMGRNFGVDPIVAVATPVNMPNGKRYVLEGSLKYLAFQHFETRYEHIEGGRLIIADGKDQVVYSSPFLKIEPLSPISSRLLEVSKQAANTPHLFTEEDGPQLVGHRVIEPIGWKVFVSQPLAISQREIRSYYAFSVGLGLLAIFVASLLAFGLARAVTNPVTQLAAACRGFILEGRKLNVKSTAFTPKEVDTLVQDFTAMGDRLGKVLTGLLPICSNCKNIRDENGEWKRVEAYIDSRTEAKFTHGMCPECAEKLYPELRLGKGAMPPHKM